jgi:DNA-binding MarR family transcriptional regulator
LPATPRKPGRENDASTDAIVNQLRGLTRDTQDLLAARAKRQGLRATDFIALIRIADGPGTTGAQLSAALGMRSSSVTGLADRLQHAGLITRGPHPTDRRLVILKATPRGRRAITRGLGPVLSRLGTVIDRLGSDERRTVQRFLTDIKRALAQ